MHSWVLLTRRTTHSWGLRPCWNVSRHRIGGRGRCTNEVRKMCPVMWMAMFSVSPIILLQSAIRCGRLPHLQNLEARLVEDDEVRVLMDMIVRAKPPFLKQIQFHHQYYPEGICLSTLFPILNGIPIEKFVSCDFPIMFHGEWEEEEEEENHDEVYMDLFVHPYAETRGCIGEGGSPTMLKQFACGLLGCPTLRYLELSPGAFAALMSGFRVMEVGNKTVPLCPSAFITSRVLSLLPPQAAECHHRHRQPRSH